MTALVWDAISGAAVTTVAVFVLLAIGVPLILDVLDVESLTVGTEGTLTYLFSSVSTPTEISLAVGPGVLSVGAVLGPIYALIWSYRRARELACEETADTTNEH